MNFASKIIGKLLQNSDVFKKSFIQKKKKMYNNYHVKHMCDLKYMTNKQLGIFFYAWWKGETNNKRKISFNKVKYIIIFIFQISQNFYTFIIKVYFKISWIYLSLLLSYPRILTDNDSWYVNHFSVM